MPTMNGIEATRQIMAEAPDTTVFLCSTYQRSDLPPEAESSGFAAYVHKEELAPDLLRRLWDDRTGLTLDLPACTHTKPCQMGISPAIAVPSPGADRHSTVPPMAPRRSLMFVKP